MYASFLFTFQNSTTFCLFPGLNWRKKIPDFQNHLRLLEPTSFYENFPSSFLETDRIVMNSQVEFIDVVQQTFIFSA